MLTRQLSRHGTARIMAACLGAFTGWSGQLDCYAQIPESAQTTSVNTIFSSGEQAELEVSLNPLQPELSPPVVTALAASRDDRYLAAAGDDHAIRLVEANTGRLLRTLAGHTDWVQSLAFSADDKRLYSAGNDGRVLCWEYAATDRPTELLSLPYALRSLSIATERGLLAVGGFSEEVGVWDLRAGVWLHKFSCSSADQRCVRFSPAGDKLLCGGRDGAVHVWEVDSGKELAHIAVHRGRVHTASFSTDGSVITSVGEDRRIVRYDLTTQQVTLNRELQGAKLRSLCLINDYLVAAAGADNTIHILYVDADEQLGKLEGHTGSVAVMCSSGKRLVSGSFDTTVRLWDIRSAFQSQRSSAGVPVSLERLEVDKRIEIR